MKGERDPLHELIREVFHLDPGFSIKDTMGSDEIPGWDSLGWVQLLNALEKRFQVELSLEQAADLETIASIRRTIWKQLPT